MAAVNDQPNQTRARLVANLLRDAIVRGEHLSGERLRELPIAAQYGVSQSTIREALQLLEREGWVVKQPRRGITVQSFTPVEANDLYLAIGALMPFVFEHVVDPARKPRLRELTQYLELAQNRIDHDRGDGAILALLQFQIALAHISSRAALVGLLLNLFNRVQIVEAVRWARAPLPSPDLSALVSRHRDVQRALGMGDTELAGRLYSQLIDVLRAGAADALAMG